MQPTSASVALICVSSVFHGNRTIESRTRDPGWPIRYRKNLRNGVPSSGPPRIDPSVTMEPVHCSDSVAQPAWSANLNIQQAEPERQMPGLQQLRVISLLNRTADVWRWNFRDGKRRHLVTFREDGNVVAPKESEFFSKGYQSDVAAIEAARRTAPRDGDNEQ